MRHRSLTGRGLPISKLEVNDAHRCQTHARRGLIFVDEGGADGRRAAEPPRGRGKSVSAPRQFRFQRLRCARKRNWWASHQQFPHAIAGSDHCQFRLPWGRGFSHEHCLPASSAAMLRAWKLLGVRDINDVNVGSLNNSDPDRW
ncbi:MAG: hypothetical protein H6636_01090 [Anaerolineales bacterium]|nr:hypothetical protein [Anaerolineales bacterium]